MSIRTLLVLLASSSMLACAAPAAEGEVDPATTDQAESAIFLTKPDLVMGSGGNLEADGSVIGLFTKNGGRYSIPCNAKWVKVGYQYSNGGAITAAAHTNTGTLGASTFAASQASLLPGAIRNGSFTFSTVNVPEGVGTLITIRLDDPAVISEMKEDNNVFKIWIEKTCIQ